jgi:hypothetical protein
MSSFGLAAARTMSHGEKTLVIGTVAGIAGLVCLAVIAVLICRRRGKVSSSSDGRRAGGEGGLLEAIA